jgi:methanogenic corrinoid protein MtbC1
MPYHRQLLRETIEQLRRSETGKDIKIMIGGNALNYSDNSWKTFGADGYALNADDAIRVANQLIQ